MTELKPCPFCGGTPVEFSIYAGKLPIFGVECEDCEAARVSDESLDGARSFWNARPECLNAGLLEALKPFADEAANYDRGDNGEPDFDDAPDASSLNEFNDLRVGDLRRARKAISLAEKSNG